MIPKSVRIFVCQQAVDMRKSFDGLTGAAKKLVEQDPKIGNLFVFINKRRNRLKVLWFDQSGCCVLAKRPHGVLFSLPDNKSIVTGQELAEIIEGVKKKSTSKRKNRTFH